jgi:hypothetical protein
MIRLTPVVLTERRAATIKRDGAAQSPPTQCDSCFGANCCNVCRLERGRNPAAVWQLLLPSGQGRCTLVLVPSPCHNAPHSLPMHVSFTCAAHLGCSQPSTTSTRTHNALLSQHFAQHHGWQQQLMPHHPSRAPCTLTTHTSWGLLATRGGQAAADPAAAVVKTATAQHPIDTNKQNSTSTPVWRYLPKDHNTKLLVLLPCHHNCRALKLNTSTCSCSTNSCSCPRRLPTPPAALGARPLPRCMLFSC